MIERTIAIPADHESNIFGQFDQYIKKIEKTFHATVISREGQIRILGSEYAANSVYDALYSAYLGLSGMPPSIDT